MDPDKETEPSERRNVWRFVRTGSGFLGQRLSASAGGRAGATKTEGSETATERAKSLKCLITVAEVEARRQTGKCQRQRRQG